MAQGVVTLDVKARPFQSQPKLVGGGKLVGGEELVGGGELVGSPGQFRFYT